MSYRQTKERLEAGKRVILDGGVGTELERRGADMDEAAWCGPASADNADLLEDVHVAYIEAGAEIVTTNTYASSRVMLNAAGMGDRVEDIARVAVDAAHRARRRGGRADVAVAGSLSHAVPMGRGTDRADRSRWPSPAELEDALIELAGILEDAGCDLLVLEMLYDPDRIPAAVSAAEAVNLPVWAGFSARRGEDGALLSYDMTRDLPFGDLAGMLKSVPRVEAAGVMHTPAHVMGDALSVLRTHYDGSLTAYPDSGYFKMPHWQFEDVIEPQKLADFAKGWIRDHGVQVLGGCCGLGPEHIEALAPLRD